SLRTLHRETACLICGLSARPAASLRARGRGRKMAAVLGAKGRTSPDPVFPNAAQFVEGRPTMRMNNGAWKVALPLVPGLWAVVAQAQTPPPGASAEVAVSSPVSCAHFMAPRKTVKGKSVGQQECLMIDHGVVEPEKKYRRVDIGISGTLSGY